MVKREDKVDQKEIVKKRDPEQKFIAELLNKLVAFRQARMNGNGLKDEKEEPWMADFNVEDFM